MLSELPTSASTGSATAVSHCSILACWPRNKWRGVLNRSCSVADSTSSTPREFRSCGPHGGTRCCHARPILRSVLN